MWGVATLSCQTEGGITNNDWNYFTTSDSIRKRISYLTTPSIFYKDIRHLQLQPAGDGIRFWESKYYLKDFENAKNIGLNCFRISLEWARIEPERNQWDEEVLDNYRRMLLSMREKGLEPIVTLHHLTLPLWVTINYFEFLVISILQLIYSLFVNFYHFFIITSDYKQAWTSYIFERFLVHQICSSTT